MDNQLGIGAFKFQSVVQKEIRSSRDINAMRSQIKIEHRLSLIEKSKQQLKQPRKLNNQQNSPQLLEPALFITNKKDQQYILNVSSSSSSSVSENDNEQNKNAQACQLIKKLKLAMGSFTPQPSPNRNQLTNRSQPKNYQRKEMQFLRSLCQNQELINCNTLKLDEYKVDKDIFVDIDCKEIMTFLRLQHEVEEMRRKQSDFQLQKERHFEILNQKNQNKHKEQHEDFWTVMMAKRTAKRLIKNMNLKRKKPEEDRSHLCMSIH